MQTEDQELRVRALASLKKKREFRAHLLAFVLVNAFLVTIWALTSPGGFFWPIFPLMGWGNRRRLQRMGRLRAGASEEEINREMDRLRQR
jgi:hypothetical protein